MTRRGTDRIARVVGEIAREEAAELRDELLRPWRRGRSGTPARVGRWVGLGLALGAVVAGVTAAVWAHRQR